MRLLLRISLLPPGGAQEDMGLTLSPWDERLSCIQCDLFLAPRTDHSLSKEMLILILVSRKVKEKYHLILYRIT